MAVHRHSHPPPCYRSRYCHSYFLFQDSVAWSAQAEGSRIHNTCRSIRRGHACPQRSVHRYVIEHVLLAQESYFSYLYRSVMIGVRIFLVIRRTEGTRPKGRNAYFASATRIIVESGLLYTASSAVLLAVAIVQDPVMYAVLDSVSALNGVGVSG
jgi:hypothetical protein